jgi:hypothetical protein
MVEMFRAAQEANGRDRFSCSAQEWQLLLSVGESFGWKPRGTTYELPANSKVDEPARRDYEPGERSDKKRVGAEDARNWARALETASRSAQLAAVIESHGKRIWPHPDIEPVTLHTLMKEVAEYAYGGSFMFAHSDRDPDIQQGSAPRHQ